MELEIITPDSKLFKGDILSVKLPGAQGNFEILNQHAAIISTLSSGKIYVSLKKGNPESFDINGGVVEVKNNKIMILAD